MKTRASGILLHISSLFSRYGIGDLGPKAYEFADFLYHAKQQYWQVLPINQISSKGNYSPYNCLSVFAGNTLFISPELLIQDGFLTRKDIRDMPAFSKTKVDYHQVESFKKKLLDIAYDRFKVKPAQRKYQQFCLNNSDWLEEYALFIAIRESFRNRPWSSWPIALRDRKTKALDSIKIRLADSINRVQFQQYIFFKQWLSLKNYCNALGIRIIGDIPIYVSHDSTDVWVHPGFFKLTKTKKPCFIAGVPPDLFSRNGQLWGNPVYDWKGLKQAGYQWWFRRGAHNLALFDIVRLDHFRGFVDYWQIPAGSKTAKKGKWVQGPKESFFNNLFKQFSTSHFIVEDLGYITADVRKLIEKYQLSCIKVLMFGFDGNNSENPHHPYNYVKNSVVYTGTHDNNTVKGWFKNEATHAQRKEVFDYIGHKAPLSQIHWEFIRLAMSSVSNTAIIPMQDVLGLGGAARMNRPATIRGNWRWRLKPEDLKLTTTKNLVQLTKLYDRI